MMTVFGDLNGWIRTEGAAVSCAPAVDGGRGEFSSTLRALAWGWGSALFQNLPPKARVDSDGKANNGGDAIEGSVEIREAKRARGCYGSGVGVLLVSGTRDCKGYSCEFINDPQGAAPALVHRSIIGSLVTSEGLAGPLPGGCFPGVWASRREP